MSLKIKKIPYISLSVEEAEAFNSQFIQAINTFFHYVRLDWESNPQRLIMEWMGMVLAISASLVLSATLPEPPMVNILATWIISSSLLLGCALSRGSTGMVIFNAILIFIDIIGLVRLGL